MEMNNLSASWVRKLTGKPAFLTIADCESEARRIQFQAAASSVIICDPLHQPKERIGPDITDRLARFLLSFPGLPEIPRPRVPSQPLTQLSSLVLRLPLPRPHHENNHRSDDAGQQSHDNPSPFHTK